MNLIGKNLVATAAAFALATALAALAAAQPATAPVSLDWTLIKTGKPLEREALITAKDAQGGPIAGARIEVSVDMPSMPMMHRIPTMVAQPGGDPGTYHARFTLEMAGDWAAQIEMKSPQRTRTVKRFSVD